MTLYSRSCLVMLLTTFIVDNVIHQEFMAAAPDKQKYDYQKAT